MVGFLSTGITRFDLMYLRKIRPFTDSLLVILLLALAACGNPPEQAADTPPVENQEETVAETPATETATDEATEAAALEALGGVAETEGLDQEIEEESEIVLQETGQQAETGTADWKYSEGKHFRRMTTSQGTSSSPDKIEVAEVFWYGCPHCFNFDPVLKTWSQDLPADVAFIKIPVIWNPTNQVHARLMYTAEALDVMDEAHEAIFKSIHQDGNMLTDESDMISLFAEFDIDEETFKETYKSFGVTSAVKRAENLTRRYGIRSVPVLVINGKYATDGTDIKTFGDMIDVTDELVERERNEK
jgi:thiol:disulfide interchange protein DsbA